MTDFVLRGGTLVFPDQAPEKKDVLVKGGKIDSLLAPDAPAPGVAEQSAKGLHVFPGLIDCHVHFGMGEKITEYSTETANAARRLVKKVYVYFNNHFASKAVVNAVMIKKQLGEMITGSYPKAFVDRYPETASIVSTELSPQLVRE